MRVNVWNKLIRRDLIVDNNILCLEGVLYEDNLWSFDLLKVLKHAGFTSEITYHHREIIYYLGKSKYGRVIWASARKVKHLVKLGNI